MLLDGILPPMISYAGPRQLSRGRASPRSCGRGSRRFFLLAAGALHVLSSFRKQAIKRRIESLALAVLGPVRSSGAHVSGRVDSSVDTVGCPQRAWRIRTRSAISSQKFRSSGASYRRQGTVVLHPGASHSRHLAQVRSARRSRGCGVSAHSRPWRLLSAFTAERLRRIRRHRFACDDSISRLGFPFCSRAVFQPSARRKDAPRKALWESAGLLYQTGITGVGLAGRSPGVNRREQSARGAMQQGCFRAPCTRRANVPLVCKVRSFLRRSCCLPCRSPVFFSTRPAGGIPYQDVLWYSSPRLGGRTCRAGPNQAS